MLDVAAVRRDFPGLAQEIYGKPLAYLDNAATTQKPQCVIDALIHHYCHDTANIHRGVHLLSQRATQAYEDARARIAAYVNASAAREIIFVRGATEAINLVATSYGLAHVGADDEVLISTLEHHSNIVPWQMLCQRVGAKLVVAPVSDDGALYADEIRQCITQRTRIVAITHMSNALGTLTPIREIADLAHAADAVCLVDGAQAIAHMPIDVQALGCDFYAFSSHKVYGPTGIGALYGRAPLLEAMQPYQGGGEMIREVRFEKTDYAAIPAKFEAGTPPIASAIGFGAAVSYLAGLSRSDVSAHEQTLLTRATTGLLTVPGLAILGTATPKGPVVSFVVEGLHPHDLGTVLDRDGICVRTGHHCAQPLMQRFGVVGTTRASFAMYNTIDEVDRLVAGVARAREVLLR